MEGMSRTTRISTLALLAVTAGLVALAVVLVAGDDPAPGGPPAAQRPTGLLWTADATRPVHEEWASYATADACFDGPEPETAPGRASSRIVQTSEVAPPGLRGSYLVRVLDGDDCAGERAEIGQGNPTKDGMEDRLFRRGDDVWIGYQFLIPSGRFPVSSNWNCLMQIKGEGKGGPLFCPSLIDERLELGTIDSREQESVGGYPLWRHDRPVMRDRWIRFLLRIRFDPDPAVGFVELHADLADGEGMRVRVPRRSLFTMKVRPDGSPTDVHARIGIYRDRAVPGYAEMYYAGFAVGRTREGVERVAFGG